MLLWSAGNLPLQMSQWISRPTPTVVSTVHFVLYLSLACTANLCCRHKTASSKNLFSTVLKSYDADLTLFLGGRLRLTQRYIYALRRLCTLSRIASLIPGLKSCELGAFLRLMREHGLLKRWSHDVFFLWCWRAHKRVFPCLDQKYTFLFIQWDFITSSTMRTSAVTAKMKAAISLPVNLL